MTQRPEIICHMITSLDGRLLTQRWPAAPDELLEVYEGTADRLGADGWIVGRNTMADFLPSGEPQPAEPARERADRIAGAPGRPLAICFDRAARLRPENGEIEGDHLVLVLPETTPEAHVDQLAARGVSVVFGGPDGMAIAPALARIAAAFGTWRLLLEGGGQINGAFLAAGVIDQASTLVFPVVDGQGGVAAIYDHGATIPARRLDLLSVETLDCGTVWMRHSLRRANETTADA
ncbi:dihydrofolate reductase family protein [Salipiger mucosus]|uniref:Putative riboflavin-specific deaminase n=1 Tax=Salipiger mucosus DSM 16094 TaxID=1123237 RepID=S9QAP1_9RHOB|nr:dihydrofolate reductase family protein [Salipiger mucosus]EPX76688.1 putative riboflavin-specific deaminase [Salipiger mucosus DSM 16094]